MMDLADVGRARELAQAIWRRNQVSSFALAKIGIGFLLAGAAYQALTFAWDWLVAPDLDLRTRCEIWKFTTDVLAKHEFDPADLKPQKMKD